MILPRKIWVCNALDTEDYDHPDGMGSCMEYWEREQNKKPYPADASYCRANHQDSAPNSPIEGGHVIGFMEQKPHVYIVPIHKSCNLLKHNLEPFRVFRSDLIRVPYKDERDILKMKSNKLQMIRMQIRVQRGKIKRFRKLAGMG